MIKLYIPKTKWSDTLASQQAYDRGRSDQAEEDAETIQEWLIRTQQIKPWLAPEIEIVEEGSE